ncbi:hypothetical protein BGZ54_007114 [Gamsiella multidivaricata]|nr:hypothetical protein BGZ54_007114 [Gamsiella multidivaricata]
MTNDHLRLFCLVSGDPISRAFSVIASSGSTVDDLKNLIKAKKTPKFDDVTASQLTLWRVSILDTDDDEHEDLPILLDALNEKKELRPTSDLSEVFSEGAPKKTIHIIVQRPLPGGLKMGIKRIADKFFACGSPAAEFLDAFVRGQQALPLATSGVRGLPNVVRRGVIKAPDSRPNLLFLDLPVPPSSTDDPIPDKFRSNVLLDVLERMHSGDFPVFGVSD